MASVESRADQRRTRIDGVEFSDALNPPRAKPQMMVEMALISGVMPRRRRPQISRDRVLSRPIRKKLTAISSTERVKIRSRVLGHPRTAPLPTAVRACGRLRSSQHCYNLARFQTAPSVRPVTPD